MTSWDTIDGRLPRTATLRWGENLSLVLTNHEEFGADYQAWVKELDGWVGGVDVHAENTQRTLSHGLFPAPSLRTGRVLNLEGYLFFGSERDRSIAERFISGVLGDGEFGTLTYRTETMPELTSTVKLDGAIKPTYYDLDTLEFQIPLIAADPFLYGTEQRFVTYPAGLNTGLRYPLFGTTMGGTEGVISFGKPNPNVRAVIQNQGNATAYPKFRAVGNFPSGFKITDAHRRVIEYPVPVFTNSPVEIDTADGSIIQNGYDQSGRASRREWFSIEPGATNSYTIDSFQPGDGHLETIHRDTYL